jgi:ubiquinone/menaquinone biosynthesis C-methylase UbiE
MCKDKEWPLGGVDRGNYDEKEAASTAYTFDQARSYDVERFTTPSGQLIHRKEFAELERALAYLPSGARILEGGCGTGRLLLEGRARGYKIDGTDASGPMLDELGRKAGGQYPDLQLLLGDAGKVLAQQESYDFVYAVRLLNQVSSALHAAEILGMMIRATKPGGLVLVEFVPSLRPR